MIGLYHSIVTKEFINNRSKKEHDYKHGRRGVDCEWPENHQSIIDPNQTLYEGKETDTIHKELEGLDYKQFAKVGVYVSPYTLTQIRKGITKHLPIWEWANNNRYQELYEGMEVSYRILGIVDAKKVLEYCEKNNTNKFPFCKKRGIILETEENYA